VDDATYSAVGAIPVPLDIGEVYTSLQTGTVGGADLPITPVYSLKLYEAAKYLTITDSYYQVAGIFISSKFLNSLPANLQKDVETAAAQAAAQQQAQANAVTNSALKAMETAGVKVITLPPAARSQWAAKADQTAVKPFESKYGTQFVDLINAGS
jgi:C4-dicarboxylate-binding protein DctP